MFTFIVPTINRSTLNYAVESVINQSITEWKAIVCGDGIMPPSFEDNRILSVMTERGDATKTREAALQYVDTEWVAFLDDDDWVAPNYLEIFYKYIESSDVIISQMMNYGTPIPQLNWIQHGQVGISFALRTDVWRVNKMPDPPSEDYKFLHLLEMKNYRISYTNNCGYFSFNSVNGFS